jgi:ureidoacrylate peracid hydrolase
MACLGVIVVVVTADTLFLRQDVVAREKTALAICRSSIGGRSNSRKQRMHKIELLPGLLERLTNRRGRPEMFPELDARRTALLAIDLQNLFMAPGAPLEIPLARAIVPRLNEMAALLRQLGGVVIWVRTVFDAEASRTWTRYFENVNAPELSSRILKGLSFGDPMHALWPDCEAHPQDLLSEKDRYSAFHSRRSRLDDILRARGIDTVLIGGTLTNICCETTARDAMQLDYKVVMLSDGCATRTDAEHNATLVSIMNNFGDVASVGEVIRRLRPGIASEVIVAVAE